LGKHLDREYLEDYEQKEKAEYERLLKDIQENRFSFEKDRFPPDERFINLQKPVSRFSGKSQHISKLWAQIPFCGSSIIILPPISKFRFEQVFFEVSEIPKIIDFIKDTGRLQVALAKSVLMYEGLDYLEPFLDRLNPPVYFGFPIDFLGNQKEIQKANITFDTIARARFLDLLTKISCEYGSSHFLPMLKLAHDIYVTLKLGHFAIVEIIENLMIDDPQRAFELLHICSQFIYNPFTDLRCNLTNFTLGEIRSSKILPRFYQPQETKFPCEIGKFLMKKSTYAPYGMDACKELMYNYDAYDLRGVQESLNKAIVANDPDIVNKSTGELSEILDNVWNDKTIPRKVKGVQIGIPLSMAAIGSVAAGPIGAAGGFLAGLGYSVADKFIDLETEGLSERLAKLKTKSYQANVYDFKQKYKHRIVKE